MSQPLIPIDFPLRGSHLIEASAGTGKTWTIAALYLRLVLGHGSDHTGFTRPLMPQEILVMTFTRAATRELSDRVRSRLLEAARCFRGEQQQKPEDEFLVQLLAAYPGEQERNQAAWRLSMAAENMDDAAIFTIDAWCQRMLREHAFDSGSVFDEQLVADETQVLTTAVQDYWRQECYPLDGGQLDQVFAIWSGVSALVDDMKSLWQQDVFLVDGHDRLIDTLEQAARRRSEVIARLRADWLPRSETMLAWLNDQDPPKSHGWNGKKLSISNCTGWLNTLRAWAEGRDGSDIPDLKTGWSRFTHEGLMGARLPGAAPIALPDVFAEFEGLLPALQAVPSIAAQARRHAAAHIIERMRQLKRQAGEFGFSDLLHRLHDALGHDEPDAASASPAHQASHQGRPGSGLRLRERILTQYPVALIDEFQDTSPIQYSLFDRIYEVQANRQDSTLLLIGDPKQSIYGFRGADIYSYLQARAATADRHYMLGVNYRSTEPLIEAVNHFFGHAEQRPGQAAFLFKQQTPEDGPSDNPLPFVKVKAHGRPEHFVRAEQAVAPLSLVHDLALQNGNQHRRRFAELCAEQIVTWLNDPGAGFLDTQTREFKRLRPADIAILVRTGREAAAVRRALKKRKVVSVYLSDRESIFESQEARDLVHWLKGVATPQDASLVRAALATGTVGLSLEELARLATHDDAFDERSHQMRELRKVWLAQGVLAMLRQSLHRLGLASRWLNDEGISGERRLTNFLHLAELLQNASSELEGEQALIRWLQIRIAELPDSGDDQIVRLESDADLVKIITIHKSKGLEYPLVFVPFASGYRELDKKNTQSVNLPLPDGGSELVLDITSEVIDQADLERLREDLRLLYVALTRARHALWIGFAALTYGNSSSCQTHKSALGYTVGGRDAREPDEWQRLLQALAEGQPHIALLEAPAKVASTRLCVGGTAAPLKALHEYAAEFDRSWTVASYSRLTRSLRHSASSLPAADMTPLAPPPRRAEDEWSDSAQTDEADVVWAQQASQDNAMAIRHRFKRGPLSGNFLHEQMEWLAGEGFALPDNPDLAKRLQLRCERAGHGEQAPALVDWFRQVLQTPLPPLGKTSLSGLSEISSEMEFWLPAESVNAQLIDAVCSRHLFPGLARPQLQGGMLHGMLMGFADLVFEHEGRYWVMDYKSNHLGNDDDAYTEQTLQAAMMQHRYDVQAAIYLLALHRLLGKRLGDVYDPAQHLGGAIYLFMRGIEGPAHGVCLVSPAVDCLAALDAMLSAAPERIASKD